MQNKPNLKKFDQLFQKGENFKITREMYISITGTDIPQRKYYTQNQSAIAKKAAEYGYIIEVVPEILCFKKK